MTTTTELEPRQTDAPTTDRGARSTQGWVTDETTTVLGEEVGLEGFGGVVSGRNGPRAVAVHPAKATPDDVVIPAAMHRRAVGTPDGRDLFGEGTGFIDQRWTTRATEFTGDVPSLDAVEDGG